MQSCHKTLGSLVGSAQLHVGRDSLVSAERVQHALNFLQTTSPNYLLLASLDGTHIGAVQVALVRKGLLGVSRLLAETADSPSEAHS